MDGDDNDNDSHTTLDDTSVDLLAPTPPPSSPEAEASPATQTLNTLSQSHIMFEEPPTVNGTKKTKKIPNRLPWKQPNNSSRSVTLPSSTPPLKETSPARSGVLVIKSSAFKSSVHKGSHRLEFRLPPTAAQDTVSNASLPPAESTAVNDNEHDDAVSSAEIEARHLPSTLKFEADLRRDPKSTCDGASDGASDDTSYAASPASPLRLLTPNLTQDSNDVESLSTTMATNKHPSNSTPTSSDEFYSQIIFNTLSRMTKGRADTVRDLSSSRVESSTSQCSDHVTGGAIDRCPGDVDQPTKTIHSSGVSATPASSGDTMTNSSKKDESSSAVVFKLHSTSIATKEADVDDQLTKTIYSSAVTQDLSSSSIPFCKPNSISVATKAVSAISTGSQSRAICKDTKKLDTSGPSDSNSTSVSKGPAKSTLDAFQSLRSSMEETMRQDLKPAHVPTVPGFVNTGHDENYITQQLDRLVVRYLVIKEAGPIGLTLTKAKIGGNEYCVVSEVIPGSLGESAGFLEADVLISAGEEGSVVTVTYEQMPQIARAKRPLKMIVARQEEEESSKTDAHTDLVAAPNVPKQSSAGVDNDDEKQAGSQSTQSLIQHEGWMGFDMSQGCRPVSGQDDESFGLQQPEMSCLSQESDPAFAEHSKATSTRQRSPDVATGGEIVSDEPQAADRPSQASATAPATKFVEDTQRTMLEEFDTLDLDNPIEEIQSTQEMSVQGSPHRKPRGIALPDSFDATDIDNIPILFCDVCTHGQQEKEHHNLCPKGTDFDRDRFVAMIEGYNLGCGHCRNEYRKGFGCAKHLNACPRKAKVGDRRSRKAKGDKQHARSSQQSQPLPELYQRRSVRRIMAETTAQPSTKSSPEKPLPKRRTSLKCPKKLSVADLKKPCLFCDGCKDGDEHHHRRCPKHPEFDRDRFLAMVKGFNNDCRGCRSEYKYGYANIGHIGGCGRRKPVKEEAVLLETESSDDDTEGTTAQSGTQSPPRQRLSKRRNSLKCPKKLSVADLKKPCLFCDGCKDGDEHHHRRCPKHPEFDRDRFLAMVKGFNNDCRGCRSEYKYGYANVGHADGCGRRKPVKEEAVLLETESSDDDTEGTTAQSGTNSRPRQRLSKRPNSFEWPEKLSTTDLRKPCLFCDGCRKAGQRHHFRCPKRPEFDRDRFLAMMKGFNKGCRGCMDEYRYGYAKRKHMGGCDRTKTEEVRSETESTGNDTQETAILPFCVACQENQGDHHHFCDLHPSFETSGAKEMMELIRAGMAVGCPACEDHYATGDHRSKRFRHSEKCPRKGKRGRPPKPRSIRHDVHQGHYSQKKSRSKAPDESQVEVFSKRREAATGRKRPRVRSGARQAEKRRRKLPAKDKQRQTTTLAQKTERGNNIGCPACKYELEEGRKAKYIAHCVECERSSKFKPSCGESQAASQVHESDISIQASQHTIASTENKDQEYPKISRKRRCSELGSQQLASPRDKLARERAAGSPGGSVDEHSSARRPHKQRKADFDDHVSVSTGSSVDEDEISRSETRPLSVCAARPPNTIDTTRIGPVTPDVTFPSVDRRHRMSHRETAGSMQGRTTLGTETDLDNQKKASIVVHHTTKGVQNEDTTAAPATSAESSRLFDRSTVAATPSARTQREAHAGGEKEKELRSLITADAAMQDAKTKFLDAKAPITEAEVPFCRACKKATTGDEIHHALCPKHPHFHHSGALEKLSKIRHGVRIGCVACTAQFERGSAGKERFKHTSECKSHGTQNTRGERRKASVACGTTPTPQPRRVGQGAKQVTPGSASLGIHDGTKIRLGSQFEVIKPDWKPCENPWGPTDYREGDVVVPGDRSFTHHEVVFSGKRFASAPFASDLGYEETHRSPEEGTHLLILTRDPLSNIPWGFTVEHHDFGGACLVRAVDPNSSASVAKCVGNSKTSPLRVHDMILAVNGKPLAGKTEVSVELELETSGVELTLTVSRYRFPSQINTLIAEHQQVAWNRLEDTLQDKRTLGWCELDLSSSGGIECNRLTVKGNLDTAKLNTRVDDDDDVSLDESIAEIAARAASGMPYRTEVQEDVHGDTTEVGESLDAISNENSDDDNDDPWSQDDNPWNGCVCGKIHESPTTVFWIQCETCDAWYNVAKSCVGFDEKEAPTKSKWTCRACPSDDEASA